MLLNFSVTHSITNISFKNKNRFSANFTRLKKLSSILLLSVYMLCTTQVTELFKLPKLFEHYEMHENWNTQITFFEFLAEHYAESNTQNGDYDEDMKLPFKTMNNSGSFMVSYVPVTQVFKLIKKVNVVPAIKWSPAPDNLFASAHLSAIWQPPKSC